MLFPGQSQISHAANHRLSEHSQKLVQENAFFLEAFLTPDELAKLARLQLTWLPVDAARTHVREVLCEHFSWKQALQDFLLTFLEYSHASSFAQNQEKYIRIMLAGLRQLCIIHALSKELSHWCIEDMTRFSQRIVHEEIRRGLPLDIQRLSNTISNREREWIATDRLIATFRFDDIFRAASHHMAHDDIVHALDIDAAVLIANLCTPSSTAQLAESVLHLLSPLLEKGKHEIQAAMNLRRHIDDLRTEAYYLEDRRKVSGRPFKEIRKLAMQRHILLAEVDLLRYPDNPAAHAVLIAAREKYQDFSRRENTSLFDLRAEHNALPAQGAIRAVAYKRSGLPQNSTHNTQNKNINRPLSRLSPSYDQITRIAFPTAHHILTENQGALPPPQHELSAWLLPSAGGKVGRGHAQPHPRPPKPNPSSNSGGPGKSKGVGISVRRPSNQNQGHTSQRVNPGKAKLPLGHITIKNKESMMFDPSDNSMTGLGRKNPYPSTKNKKILLTGRGSHEHDAQRNQQSALGKDTQGIGNMTRIHPFAKGKAMFEVSCLRFHDVNETWRQIMKLRFKKVSISYCIHRDAVPIFEVMLAHKGRKEKTIFASQLIHETVLPEQKEILINKYRGMGKLTQHAPGYKEAIGKDELYSIITISVLPHERLRHKTVQSDQIFPQNSFKLIEHTSPIGTSTFFIAYFLYKPTGIKAGFLEVDTSVADFRIKDEQTGFVFVSDNIHDFVLGFERVSGLRFRPDSEVLSHLEVPQARDVVTTNAGSLFVRAEAIQENDPPHNRKIFNAALNAFSPVTINKLQLYRTCFCVSNNAIIYVDKYGDDGRLQLSARGQRYKLEKGSDAQFIDGYGLEEGKEYDMEALIEILENDGLTCMPLLGDIRQKTNGRLDNFYIQPQKKRTADKVEKSHEVRLAQDRYPIFSFSEGQLQYVDQEGKEGHLTFKGNEEQTVWTYHAEDNNRQDIIFASQNSLTEGDRYNTSAILSALFRRRFIRVTDVIYRKLIRANKQPLKPSIAGC